MKTAEWNKDRDRILKRILLLAVAVMLLSALHGCGQKENQSAQNKTGGGAERAAESEKEEGKASPEGGEGTAAEGGSPGTPSGRKEGGGGNGSAGVSEDGNTEQKIPLARRICHTGDAVQDGDLRIVYISSGEYREESEYLQPEDGYRYIFLHFSFENTSGEEDSRVSLFSFSCYADGYAAQPFFGAENELSAALPPGRSATGSAYFLVPENAEEIEVEYTPSSPEAERAVFVYEGSKDSGYVPRADSAASEDALQPGSLRNTDRESITYLSCEKDKSDNTFIQPAEGCSFYTISVTIENLQAEDLQVSFYDFGCYADGQSCRSVWFRDDALSATVPSGRKAKGTVSFEVPDSAQTVEAEFRTGPAVKDRVIFRIR